MRRASVLKVGILLGMTIPLTLFFQNCSDFTLQDELIYDQSLQASREALDAALLPSLLSSESLKFKWKMNEASLQATPTIYGDQWSMVFAVDATIRGKIATIHSSNGVEEGSITITNDGKIQAVRSNASPAYEQRLEATIPSGVNKLVIAASFGEKKSEIWLLVNGRVQRTAVTSQSTPLDFSYISRRLVLQDPEGKIYEYMAYIGDSQGTTGFLNAKELNVLSRYVANNQMIPSVIYDPTLIDSEAPGSGGSPSIESAEFVAAKDVFQRNCTECHKSGGTSPNLTGLSEDVAVANGWVVKNNPQSSMLYYRLQGVGAGNMPPSPRTLSPADVLIVRNWINSIK